MTRCGHYEYASNTGADLGRLGNYGPAAPTGGAAPPARTR